VDVIDVTINGNARRLDQEATIEELLKKLGIPKEGAAIAVNGAVVPRSKHSEHMIADGDRLEIIRAVGGG
jgi:sulfur carrier protein